MKTDNELIAEFLGWEKTNVVWDNDEYAYTCKFPVSYNYLWIPSIMPFNKSWDWLMPVVEKIGQLDGDYTVSINTQKEPSLYGHECSIYDTGHAVSFVEESKTLIESVYTAVIEFIKWYNDSVLIEREKE